MRAKWRENTLNTIYKQNQSRSRMRERGEVHDAMKELFIKYYNMKKRRALLFRREIRNVLRILWHHPSKSLMLLCSLCFSVVPPCTQKFCIHLFSFHIPMMMRSCLSKLVSQAQHLCLTVSKAVTLVSIARKIFCLSFFIWENKM